MGLGEGTVSFDDLFTEEANPELHEFAQYIELNPAFHPEHWGDPRLRDPRVIAEFERIFYKDPETQEAHKDREVQRRLELFQIAVRSKIAQLLGNEVWAAKGGSTEQEFREAPRTFLKTVQEVLVHPTERMVFEREDAEAVGDTIIDPRRISDKLLENLGLEEFIPEKGTRQEEKLRRKAEAIPEIKAMLKNLEPILSRGDKEGEANYFRLMRIKGGKYEGQLMGTQEVAGQKRLFRCRDLQDAYRRIRHIEDGYEAEVARLTEIMTTLKGVRDDLDDWNEIKYTGALEGLKAKLAECFNALKFARDKSKRKMKQKISRDLELKDSSGPYAGRRLNPGKIQASIVSSIGRGVLGQRFRRITGISQKIAEDRVRLGEMIQGQRAPMYRFLILVEKLHQDLLILNPSEPLQRGDKKRIKRNLRKLREYTGELRFQPHLSFGEKFIEQIDAAITALEGDDHDLAAKEFLKMYLIAKIERAYTQIKQTQRKLSLEPDTIDHNELKDELQAFHVEMEKHMVAAKIKVGKSDPIDCTYYDAYVSVYYLFNSLKKRLIEIEQSGNDPDVRQEKLAEMKARISEFDFALVVQTLDNPALENPFLPDYPKP